MNENLFERKEKKYVLERACFERLLEAIGPHTEDDRFSRALITSLYYDTPEHLLISRSIENPLYKEKLRVRAYGSPGRTDAVYLELKKKFKGIVYKRRVPLTMRAANLYLQGIPYEKAVAACPLADATLQREATSPRGLLTAREIERTFARHRPLYPSMVISTHRLSIRGKHEEGLRITFDVDPVWRADRLSLAIGHAGTPIYPDAQVIMEVKCLGAYPRWLLDVFDELHILPTSCSKYAIAFAAHERGQAFSEKKGPLYA